jgi:hypothetical protein
VNSLSHAEPQAPQPKRQDADGFKPPTALVWFGVMGGGFAWITQHVLGYGASLARCAPTGTGDVLPLNAWQIGLAAAATAVDLAALGVCAWVFLRTFKVDDVAGQERRGEGSPPPVGRLHFLAIVGLVVNFLALAIIVLDGVGAPLLGGCLQA